MNRKKIRSLILHSDGIPPTRVDYELRPHIKCDVFKIKSVLSLSKMPIITTVPCFSNPSLLAVSFAHECLSDVRFWDRGKSLIILSETLSFFSPLLYCSTLAHEFRHVWQNEHSLFTKDENFYGSGVDLSPKEIDADAFSIAYLCKYENTSWNDACQATIDYHTTTDKGRVARIESAKKIYTSF